MLCRWSLAALIAVAFTIASAGLAQDDPCRAQITGLSYEWTSDTMFRVNVHHNGDIGKATYLWRGGTYTVFGPGNNPTGYGFDGSCLLQGDTVEVHLEKCARPDLSAIGSVSISPPNVQPTVSIQKPPPNWEQLTFRVDYGFPNAAGNVRLRSVLHSRRFPDGLVLKDTAVLPTLPWGTVGTGAGGEEGTIIVKATSCGVLVAQDYTNTTQDDCDCTGVKECVGNPVNTHSGTMLYEDVDPVPSAEFLPFRRTYISTTTNHDGLLGPRWFSMFDAGLYTFVDIDGVRYVTVEDEKHARSTFEGRDGLYRQIETGGIQNATLVARADGTWAHTDAGGRLTRIFNAQGLPVAYRDVPTGRELRLSWENGLPVQVADSWGHWTLDVTTDATARRITAIAVAGRPELVWRYVYDYHLMRVESPVGTWRSYEYVLPDYPKSEWRLVRIRDGAGNLIESHNYEYSGAGRAITSHGPAGEIDSIEGRLPGRSANEYKSVIQYKSGRIEAYYRRYVAGRWRTVEVDGGCASCGTDVTSIVFDARANVIRAQGSDGYITVNTYDGASSRVLTTRTALRPVDCDPSTAPDQCRLTTDLLATVEVVETSATEETTFAYEDPNWPERATTTSTKSVRDPAGTRREIVILDPATGEVLQQRVTGWTGNPAREESRVTTTVLYNGTDGAAFAPGGAFSTAWLLLPQPRFRKSVDGPLTATADVTTYVHYPIDPAVPTTWRGRLAATRNAAGHIVRFEDYDVFGNATTTVDANGVVHRTTYDALGRLTASTTHGISGCDTTADPLCATDLTATRVYAGGGPLTSETQPAGGVTSYTYDDRGRVRTVSRGPSLTDLREQVESSYDPATGKKSIERILARESGTWVEKKRVTSVYDTSERLKEVRHADAASVAYEYDAAGRISSVRDENHAAPNTRYDYDPAGRLTRVRQALASAPSGWIETRYAYDLHGNLTSVTDPNGNVTQYVYDDFGAMLSQSSPVSGVTAYAYDTAGQLVSVTDANGATTTRTYDALGRVSNATSVRNAETEVVTWTYDTGTFGRGRLSKMTDDVGETRYEYDRRGLLTRETKETGASPYVSSYRFDVNGNRSRITYPSGRAVDFAYDYAGRPVSASTGSLTLVSSAVYLPFGPWTEVVLGNGTTRRRTYDSRYAILTNTLTGAAGPIASYGYEDDAAGNITAIRDLRDARYDRTFGYDGLHRLTTAASGSLLWGSGSYAYDAMGNLRTATLGTRTSSFTYSGTTPKLTSVHDDGTVSNVAYDAAGNEIAAGALQSAYSPANHLARAAEYSYDYDGRGVRTVTRLAGPAVASLVVSPLSIVGGGAIQATLTLTAPAPAGGTLVRLSGDPTLLDVPETVLVPPGASSTTFTVPTNATLVDRTATIRASHGLQAGAAVSVLSACQFDRIELSPSSVTGGTSVTGTIVLAAPRSADQPVTITSTNAAVAAVPGSITIPAGQTSASFSIATTAVVTSTDVTITASACGNVSASLTVQSPTIQSLTVTPASVLSGASATATATLTGPAAAGGAVVALTSSDPAAVSMPSQATISAGSSSANVVVSSAIRTTDASVILSGTTGGVTRSATLTVLRCGTPPAPPQFGLDEVVWFDDAPPTGAVLRGNWNWDTTLYASGTRSIVDPAIAGSHEMWFDSAGDRMTPLVSDKVFVYAMLDPCNPPRAIMLGWTGGSGWPRAYWGEDLYPYDPRVRMGNLPAPGQWVRLEVPAYVLGIGGQSVHGMALSVYGGRVWFDRAGKRSCEAQNGSPALTFPQDEVVWFDDDLPAGAQRNGNWSWDTQMKASGTRSHVEPPAAGAAERSFAYATATLTPGPQDELFVYAYIDPCAPPREIMVGWFDGGWPRAYWGENIFGWGPRTRMGDIPAGGGWVKLTVPASTMGLVGRTISGMAFSVYGGRAWFDRAGVNACTFPAPPLVTLGSNDMVWVDENVPAGAGLGGTWVWDTSQKAGGTKSMIAAPWTGTREFSFSWPTTPLRPAPEDKLFVYVLVDPCAPPRQIMVGWYNGEWPRAYWGEDLFGWGPRTRIGDIPAGGSWVRLEVPASVIGPSGQTINGMAFSVHSGRVWFDLAGMSTAGSAVNPPMMSSSATNTASDLRRYSLYTPELQLMAETELTDAMSPSVAYEYIWFGGEPLAQIETPTGNVHWYFNDHLGTPILTTSQSGAIDWQIEREPYGEELARRAGLDRHQPLGFPGQEDDGGPGIAYNVFRWYRAGWGRYTQADPIGLVGREYPYASNDPILHTDMLGLRDTGTVLGRPAIGAACRIAGKTAGWVAGRALGLISLIFSASNANPVEFEAQRGECDPCVERRRQCDELNEAVQEAKRRVGDLGACRAGMSRSELLLRRAAWLELATARARRDVKCWGGGDPGHQQAQSDAWSHIGNCSRLLGL